MTIKKVLKYLDTVLLERTYLVDERLTIADIAVAAHLDRGFQYVSIPFPVFPFSFLPSLVGFFDFDHPLSGICCLLCTLRFTLLSWVLLKHSPLSVLFIFPFRPQFGCCSDVTFEFYGRRLILSVVRCRIQDRIPQCRPILDFDPQLQALHRRLG